VKYVLAFLIGAIAHAGCDFPVPPYKIHETQFTGIDRASFMRIMDRVEAAYAPIFQAAGCPLVLHRSWSDGTVNAQAWQENGECHVEMFGGLARYPGMTSGAMAQVAAHEIGHHLGGYPFYPGESLSDEGQADFYSTATGMYQLAIASPIPSRVLADTLARLNGEAKTSLPGPVLPSVKRTFHEHPHAQCRRVTFEAGRVHGARPRCWFKS
jgi:hypothetical protein